MLCSNVFQIKVKKVERNAKKTAKNFSVQKMIEKYEVCYRKF